MCSFGKDREQVCTISKGELSAEDQNRTEQGDKEKMKEGMCGQRGLSPKMSTKQGPEGSGRTFQIVGTERAKTPKAAVYLHV